MEVLTTPGQFFENLEGFNFDAHYVEIEDQLKMHYVHENNEKSNETILLLHGEPSWSYLYRKMIIALVANGYEVIAPDLIGFGKSDKPAKQEDYSYRRHLDWLKSFIKKLDLKAITLFCQDWGGLLGLRILAEQSHLFKRAVAANTFLPTGDIPPNEAFLNWQKFSRESPKFDIGTIIQKATVSDLSEEVIRAYNAPFPDDSYKAGARIFPSLVPTTPSDPETANNRKAIKILMELDIPFLTAFGDSDPIMKGLDKILQQIIPGAKGQSHLVIENAGHFLQEDKGEELAEVVHQFIIDNP